MIEWQPSLERPPPRKTAQPEAAGLLCWEGLGSGFERHFCFAHLKELAINTQECAHLWNLPIATRTHSRLLIDDIGLRVKSNFGSAVGTLEADGVQFLQLEDLPTLAHTAILPPVRSAWRYNAPMRTRIPPFVLLAKSVQLPPAIAA